MTKEFDSWNERKKKLHQREKPPYFKEREIWWCTVGLNVGTEQDGKGTNFSRPVVVLRKFSNDQFIGIPSTRSMKTSRFYHLLKTDTDKFNFILSQLRVFDSRRLQDRIVTVSKGEMTQLKQAVRILHKL